MTSWSSVINIARGELEKVTEIGTGGFSTVYHMTWKSYWGVAVAAKRLNRPDREELNILSRLNHPNIVKLVGEVDEGTEYMLILELCSGGSLRSHLNKLKNEGKTLSTDHFYDWAEQAARPIRYLKKMKFVHKDIKSSNYLIAEGNVLKLADFGLAKNMSRSKSQASGSCSAAWMAPELETDGILSPTYDIFAYAVVLWELWTTDIPHEGKERHHIKFTVCKGKRLPIPSNMPRRLVQLIERCWQKDWKKRPSVDEVLDVIIQSKAADLKNHDTIPVDEALCASSRISEDQCGRLEFEGTNVNEEGCQLEGLTEQTEPCQSDQPFSPLTESNTAVTNQEVLQETPFASPDCAGPDLNQDTTETDSFQLPRVQAADLDTWIMEKEIPIPDTVYLHAIAVYPSGNIAILSPLADSPQAKICDSSGDFIFGIPETNPPFPKCELWDIAINSESCLFVSENSQNVNVYDENGTELEEIVPSECEFEGPPVITISTETRGLAFDTNDNLFVGVKKEVKDRDAILDLGGLPGTGIRFFGANVFTPQPFIFHMTGCVSPPEEKTRKKYFVSKHAPDGTQMSSFELNIDPLSLAVTPVDTIAVSDQHGSLQIIDQHGDIQYKLKTRNDNWFPGSICCCEDVIYVGNERIEEIHCFSLALQYLCRIPIAKPAICLTVTSDANKLLLCSKNILLIYDRKTES